MTTFSRISMVLLVALIGPLSLLYASLLYWLARNPDFLPIGVVEAAVFVTLIVRTLVILVVPGFRKANFFSTWMVFVPDLLVAAVLVACSVAAGDAYLLSLSRQLFGAWVPAFLIAFLPLAMYKIGSKMRNKTSPISETLPSLTFIFVTLAVFVSATYSPAPSAQGLQGISQLIYGVVFGSRIASSQPLLLSVAGTVLAVAVVVYAVSQGSGAPVMRILLLSFIVIGLAATIGWGLIISSVTQSSTIAFSIPALVLLATIWGVTRAR